MSALEGKTMEFRSYRASLSRSQGREGWSVLFRHPVRQDEATGKPGKRVRRGLATRDRGEAESLVQEVNQLLADTTYWDPAARATAEQRFDPRVVDIFFDKMVPEETNFAAVRDEIIPFPSTADVRKVLLLGTTGAGKTTLVRQLIGTDPVTEKFPSTSTAKTTIADTEIVFDHGDYRAVVTFFSRDEVRDNVEECLSAAVLAAHRGAGPTEVLRKLFVHVNQRFRLNYILGNGPTIATEGAEDDPDEEGAEILPEELGFIDLGPSDVLLASIPDRLRAISQRLAEIVRADLNASQDDERVLAELLEEELDTLLREDEDFHEIADDIMDEIERRFDAIQVGAVRRTRQGWPLSWSWENGDRREFIRAVLRFSSNYSPLFGRLLTPLVSGIRVAGPFSAEWGPRPMPTLVLLDGEGLGHSPNSVAAIPTSVSRRFAEVDAVLLVDNATQPMQAASVAALRALAASGNASKLLICFTHFDGVRGDNLPTAEAKEQHILASAENVLASIGEDLGPVAAKALRRRLENARFFVGGIDHRLDISTRKGTSTVAQLTGLLAAIDLVVERPAPVPVRPVYDRLNLALAVKAAAESFREAWLPRLGLEMQAGVTKEHWTRVKALSRRLAQGWQDEYDTLRPVADLHLMLQNRVYVLIQNPVEWSGPEPSESEKEQVFDLFAEKLHGRLLELATLRIKEERVSAWQDAYNRRGTGSTFERAQIIAQDVYDKAAPVPDVTPSPDRNRFLHEVVGVVEAVALEVGVELR